MNPRILVVDDEPGVREALRQVLEYEGMEVELASSGSEGLAAFERVKPHVVLLDVKMAGLDGLETLAQLKEQAPDAMVVMISGHGTIATAVQATQSGAFDFLEKPLDTDRLLVTLRNAMSHASLAGENVRLRDDVDTDYPMVGSSAALAEVREVIARVAPTDARVLITGENGTGKELVARAIHEGSARAKRPFIEVNCAAIPTELIESELFGHMKGSFTGAVTDRAGKFELADGGTLFLDEVGDMSLSAQAKVLRVLQEGLVTRIGSPRPTQVDVRVLAATNKDIAREIQAGRFREDLYYRLNVVPVTVPPLRDRREDIPELVAHFVAMLSGKTGIVAKPFDETAVAQLEKRTWPGNVRELRNAVERLLILSAGKSVTGADVNRLLGSSPRRRGGRNQESLDAIKEEVEREVVEAKLKELGGNVAETAKALGVARSVLYRRIKQLGLDREE